MPLAVGLKQQVPQHTFTNSGQVLIMGDVFVCLPLAAGHTPSGRMSRRRLDGEAHLAFGISHSRLMLDVVCDGSEVVVAR
jgi:hypothetical protein